MSTKSIFLQGYSRKPVQVQRYNHPKYKHALDDAIEKLLTHDHKYKQIHTLPDTKMLLGYIAVAFAAYGTYLSYGLALEMPQIKYTLLVCVIGFFTFQSLMMGYSRWIEGDIVFQGRKVDLVGRNDEHVSVSSKCAHLDDKYALEIVWTRGGRRASIRLCRVLDAGSVRMERLLPKISRGILRAYLKRQKVRKRSNC